MAFFKRRPGSSLRDLMGDLGVEFLKKGELDGVSRRVGCEFILVRERVGVVFYSATGFADSANWSASESLLAEHDIRSDC